jgi:serine/threonine-protein kinase RsbW
VSRADDGNAYQVTRPASAQHAADLRHALTTWAMVAGLPSEVVEGVTLAAYEAMANVIDHAYDAHVPGSFEIDARVRDGVVTVMVTDHGRWLPARSVPDPLRGRGMTLIHGVADEASVSSGDSGTTVTMRWFLPE